MFFRGRKEYFSGNGVGELHIPSVHKYYQGLNQGFVSRIEYFKDPNIRNKCMSEITIKHTIGLDKVEGDVILEHQASTGESKYNTLSLIKTLREYLNSIASVSSWECRIIHPHDASIFSGDFIIEFTSFNLDNSISDVFHVEGVTNNFLVENCLIEETHKTEDGRYYASQFDPEWIKSIVMPVVNATCHVSNRYTLPGKDYHLNVVTYKPYKDSMNSIVVSVEEYLDSPRNYPYEKQKIYLKEIVICPMDMREEKNAFTDEMMNFIQNDLPKRQEISDLGYSSLINIYSTITHDLMKKYHRYYCVYFVDQDGNHIPTGAYDFISGPAKIQNAMEIIRGLIAEFHTYIDGEPTWIGE